MCLIPADKENERQHAIETEQHLKIALSYKHVTMTILITPPSVKSWTIEGNGNLPLLAILLEVDAQYWTNHTKILTLTHSLDTRETCPLNKRLY